MLSHPICQYTSLKLTVHFHFRLLSVCNSGPEIHHSVNHTATDMHLNSTGSYR